MVRLSSWLATTSLDLAALRDPSSRVIARVGMRPLERWFYRWCLSRVPAAPGDSDGARRDEGAVAKRHKYAQKSYEWQERPGATSGRSSRSPSSQGSVKDQNPI